MRQFARISIAALACLFSFTGAQSLAQGYPNKPIRFIVPFPAGGGADYVARAVGRHLIHESGVENFDASGWISCMLPTGTPREIVTRLNDEIGKAVRSPEIQKQWVERGYLSMPGSPDQYALFVKQEIDKWGGVSRALGITLD